MNKKQVEIFKVIQYDIDCIEELIPTRKKKEFIDDWRLP